MGLAYLWVSPRLLLAQIVLNSALLVSIPCVMLVLMAISYPAPINVWLVLSTVYHVLIPHFATNATKSAV